MSNFLVDELGLIQAEKARLAKREAEVKKLLSPKGTHGTVTLSGDLFDVTIAPVAPRDTLSMARAKLFLTEALLSKITVRSKASVRWIVSARNSEKVAA